MTPRTGRPLKPAGEAYSVMTSLRLTPHQKKVLDALVAHTRKLPGHGEHETAQTILRDLLKARYLQAIRFETMEPVARDD